MASSAIASSSLVVTPGRTAARSVSRVRPTTSPTRRIAATWSGVFSSTPRSCQPIRSAGSGLRDDVEGVEDALGDLGHLAHAVDLDQDATVAVDLDERLGLLGVDLLAAPDDLLGVVRAPLDLG